MSNREKKEQIRNDEKKEAGARGVHDKKPHKRGENQMGTPTHCGKKKRGRGGGDVARPASAGGGAVMILMNKKGRKK